MDDNERMDLAFTIGSAMLDGTDIDLDLGAFHISTRRGTSLRGVAIVTYDRRDGPRPAVDPNAARLTGGAVVGAVIHARTRHDSTGSA